MAHYGRVSQEEWIHGEDLKREAMFSHVPPEERVRAIVDRAERLFSIAYL
jgi:hypothetical protein